LLGFRFWRSATYAISQQSSADEVRRLRLGAERRATFTFHRSAVTIDVLMEWYGFPRSASNMLNLF
jgi:hypothetical protein